MSDVSDPIAWGQWLADLGRSVQMQLRRTLADSAEDPAQAVAEEGGDRIYAIDRYVEPILLRSIDSWPDECKPLLLIAEGLGNDGRRRFGRSADAVKFRLLVDPIDGTRGLMYDKRSAWFLAAIACDQGEGTTLADTIAATMVELPTSKQCWADTLIAVAGKPPVGRRLRIGTEQSLDLRLGPSQARTLKDGFGQVSNFFPGTKVLASELMERIVARTLGGIRLGTADVFDDQYISSGGQMVELILGHDRFCCDLRPLFYEILEKRERGTVRGVQCHPYDIAGAFVATQAGVILTDGFGQPLNAPLNVTCGVHWCGYANAALQDAIQPIVLEWLEEHGLTPDSHGLKDTGSG